jgi:hypothetical protein
MWYIINLWKWSFSVEQGVGPKLSSERKIFSLLFHVFSNHQQKFYCLSRASLSQSKHDPENTIWILMNSSWIITTYHSCTLLHVPRYKTATCPTVQQYRPLYLSQYFHFGCYCCEWFLKINYRLEYWVPIWILRHPKSSVIEPQDMKK